LDDEASVRNDMMDGMEVSGERQERPRSVCSGQLPSTTNMKQHHFCSCIHCIMTLPYVHAALRFIIQESASIRLDCLVLLLSPAGSLLTTILELRIKQRLPTLERKPQANDCACQSLSWAVSSSDCSCTSFSWIDLRCVNTGTTSYMVLLETSLLQASRSRETYLLAHHPFNQPMSTKENPQPGLHLLPPNSVQSPVPYSEDPYGLSESARNSPRLHRPI
jgi:hypothetical protein